MTTVSKAQYKKNLQRLKKSLKVEFKTNPNTQSALIVGQKHVKIDGNYYNAQVDGSSNTIASVTNIGRLSAAIYSTSESGVVPRSSAATVVSSGGGGGGDGAPTTAPYLLTESATGLTAYRTLDVTTGLTKTDGGALSALTIGLNTPGALTVSSTNTATGNHTHAITASAAPGAAESLLKSTSAGNLTLPTFTATTKLVAPELETASGVLTLDGVGGTLIDSAGNGLTQIGTVAGASGNGTIRASIFLSRNGDVTWDGTYWQKSGTVDWSAIMERSPGDLAFFTIPNGVSLTDKTNTSFVSDYQRLKITSTGNVLIGTDTDSGSYKLDVAGALRSTSTVYANTSVSTPIVTTASGDLTLSPADDIMLDPTSNLVKTTSGVSLQADNYASQVSGWRITYDGQGDFRYIYTDELHAKAFIADLEQALAGGQIIAKSVAILYSDFTAPAAGATAQLVVSDLPSATGMAVFVDGDYVRIREFSRSGGSLTIADCWGTVALDTSYGTSGFDSATKSQRYTFTRSSSPNAGAMSEGNVVEADAIILDYGTSGNGFYEVNAIDGLYGANSPYAQIVTWSGHPRTQTVRARLGNLYGIWSVSGEYGLYAGSGVTDDDSYLRISSESVRLNNVPLQLYDSGTQTVNIDSTGTDIWIGNGSSDKLLTFDGSSLSLLANNSEVITLDTSGNSYFAGVMTIGVSGEIRQGTGTLGTDYTGLRIWRSSDVGLIAGYNTDVEQWYADTDGKLYAGAGAVWLDANGVNFDVPTVGGDYIRFVHSGSKVGDIAFLRASGPTPASTDGMVFTNDQSTKFRFVGAGSTEFDHAIVVTSGGASITGNIVVSGTVDGVDIAAFKTAYDSHNHNGTYLPLSGGVMTGLIDTQTLRPVTTDTYSIGTASYYYDKIFVRSLYTDTIVGTPSYSHQHDDDYVNVTGDTMTGTLELLFDDYLMLRLDRTANASVSNTYDVGVSFGSGVDYAYFGRTDGLQVRNDSTVYVGGNLVWHAGNDGSGSGLDADTVDGVQAASFVQTSRTVTGANGLTGGGALSSNQVISHADTSSQSSVNNSGYTFIQDVTLDDYGHVTALVSADASAMLTGYLKADGTVAGATSQAQAFTNGVTTTVVNSTTTLELQKSGAAVVAIDSSSRLGLGGAASSASTVLVTGSGAQNAALQVSGSAALYGLNVAPTITPSSSTAQVVRAVGTINLSSNIAAVYSLNNNINFTAGSGNTITSAYGMFLRPTLVNWAGTITTYYGARANALTTSGTVTGSITNYTAFSSADISSSVTGTAIAYEGLVQSGTNHYNLYMNGTADNYLRGNTGIGTTPSASYALSVGGTASISTSLATPTITTASGALTLSPTTYTSVDGDLEVVGVAYGDSWDISQTGDARFGPDTDVEVELGRAIVGYGSDTDNASFSHYDFNTDAAAGLVQYWTGDTRVQAADTRNVQLAINDDVIWYVNSERLMPKGSVEIDIGDYNRQVRSLFASELVVQTLVAQEVLATVGGQIIVAPTTKLIADLAATTGGAGTDALASNLVAYWTLDEASGNRTDSVSAIVLTNNNTVTSATGKVGTAAVFTKANTEYLSAADSATLSVGDIDFYTAGWIYPTLNDGSIMTIVQKGSSSQPAWAININWGDSKVYFDAYNSSGSLTYIGSSSTITINTWYFVQVWHDATANQIAISLNNGTAATAAHTGGIRDDSGALTFGISYTDSIQRVYQGRIDEWGIWKNYIPDSTRRTWLYNSGSGRTYTDIYDYGSSGAATTIDVEHNFLASGDYILMKTAPSGVAQIEVMKITSSDTVITGGYRYSVTRNLDGTSANNWYTGDAVVSLGGAVGEGYIDLTSTSTVHNHLGPTMAVYSRTATTNWNDTKAVVSVGNLRSFVDYASDKFGIAFGNDLTLTPTTGFTGLTADTTNGLRLFNVDLSSYNSTVQTVDLSSTGNLKLGTNVSNAATTALDFVASTGALRVGNLGSNLPNLYFDGTNLHLRSNTTNVITLASDGTSYFSNVMTLGTSGEIRQGTGTIGSNYTGLRIWRSSSVGLIAGYNNNVQQWYTNTDGKLYAGAGAVILDASGITVGTNKFTVDTSGNIKAGTNVGSAATTTFDVVASSGATRLGPLGAGKPNVYFDGTDLLLRINTTTVFKFASTGATTFEDDINLGTNGGIYQGSGTFASPTTGLKIWNDGGTGRIGGYNSGTLQWYANTDGKLYAGGGAAWLDTDGLNIEADSTDDHISHLNANAVSFKRSGGTLVGRLTSYYLSGSGTYGLDLYARSPNQEPTYARFGAEQAGTTYGAGAAGAPRIVANAAVAGGGYLSLYANTQMNMYVSGSASPDMSISNSRIAFNTELGDWTALTLNTGWANYGSGFATAAYKQVGDLIILRGLIARTSGTATIMLTLPSGKEPIATDAFPVVTSSGFGQANVSSTGTVSLAAGGTTYVSLAGIVFSTT